MFITTWRKTGEQCLDWDHYVSQSEDELNRLIKNITTQGVHQYHTYELGRPLSEYSSEY